MSNSYEPNHHKHKLRFYIVMGTLLAVGLFFIFNNTNGPSGLTGAITGGTTADTMLLNSEKVSSGNKQISLNFSFNQFPKAVKNIKINLIKIKSKGPSSKISINGDQLELSNVKEVALEISGFNGQTSLEKGLLSLDGTAHRVDVNGVALSSPKDKLKVSFANLEYQFVELSGVAMQDFDFPQGSGSLAVNSKLTYALSDDKVNIGAFQGTLAVTDTVVLEGKAGSVKLSGPNLNVALS